jgi:hypothetical protein
MPHDSRRFEFLTAVLPVLQNIKLPLFSGANNPTKMTA